jgi:hypothetical protein
MEESEMNRVLLTGLLLLALLALGCNKAGDKKTAAGQAQAGDQAAPVMASGAGTEGLEVTQAPDPREAKEEYVQLVKQIAPEYGIRYDNEKDMLYTPEGVALGTPAELASRVDSLMDPAAVPAMGEPLEAIRYMLEGLVNPAPPAEPPQEVAPQVEEPIAEKPDLSNLNTEEMVAALAPEYNLTYDRDKQTLNGEGFRAGGVDIGIVASKVDINLQQRGEDNPQAREAEVRTVLSQLVDAGKQAAAQRQDSQGSATAEADTGAAQSGRGRKPLEYHPDSSELIHPLEVYGDWKSIREDHPNNDEVAHDDNWYYDVQLRYRGNAVFRLHTNGEVASNNEFPYRYDPRNGVLSLLDAQGEAVQTYTVWATEQDPLLIWLQREGSRIKTLYQKVGLGGEPVTEEELIAGIRELLGEEGVQNYLKYKEQQRREQGGK